MNKQEIEEMLIKLGVPIVRSKIGTPISEEELDEIREKLSQTNFINTIDKQEA